MSSMMTTKQGHTHRSVGNRKKKTGFFSLPAELRNDIYRLVLVEPDPIHLHVATARNGSVDICRFGKNGLPALIKANSLITSECKRIYFEENTFRFEYDTLNYHALEYFYREIGDSLRRIKGIDVYRTYQIGDMKPIEIAFQVGILPNTRGKLIIRRPANEKYVFPGITSKIRGPNTEPCRCDVLKLLNQCGCWKNEFAIIDFLEGYADLIKGHAKNSRISVCSVCNSVFRK